MYTLYSIQISAITAGIAILFVLLLVFIEGKIHQSSKLLTIVKHSILIIAMAVLGAVAGFSGGLSRVGTVGNIIPAAMGLLGGITVYLFGVKPHSSSITPIIVIVFAMSLLQGFTKGAETRDRRETFNKIQEACINLYFSPNSMTVEKINLIDETNGKICKAVFFETINKIKEKIKPSKK